MAKKPNSFYFDNYVACADLAVQAAELLTQIFENFDPAKIHDMLEEMHAIEHAADKKHHELEDALLTAFITPLEREDLNLMSCSLDTVLDRIEGVVQRVYFTNIQSIHPDAIVIAHKVTDACRAMKDLMVELPNYRKSKTLRELVIQINTIESEADELYINAMRNLHVNGKDPLEVIAWRDVYAFLEYCADCCENVADVVDSIVMKLIGGTCPGGEGPTPICFLTPAALQSRSKVNRCRAFALRITIGTLADGLDVMGLWLMRPFMPERVLWGCAGRLAGWCFGYLFV